jgi:hypothetical protein
MEVIILIIYPKLMNSLGKNQNLNKRLIEILSSFQTVTLEVHLSPHLLHLQITELEVLHLSQKKF